MKRRGATPEEDRANGWIEEGVITEVTPYKDGPGWSVGYGDSMGCGVRDVGVEPKVGDTLTIFGQFGYSFHGQALNGQVIWYLSPEEEESEFEASQRARQAQQRAEFEANRATLDADYDSLPETFKERIDKFRRTNPEFRWEFEGYEMMCCKDALKIAAYCSVNRLAEGEEPTAAENVGAYQKLPYEEQKKAGITEGHSGNSFGFAVRLAYLWVTDPGMVVQEHGALTPLVGCIEYGCPHEESLPDQSGSFLRSWRLTAGIVVAAFVVYFARHPGWTGAAALGIVVVSGIAAIAYLASRSLADPDRASVAEFEERRRALR